MPFRRIPAEETVVEQVQFQGGALVALVGVVDDLGGKQPVEGVIRERQAHSRISP